MYRLVRAAVAVLALSLAACSQTATPRAASSAANAPTTAAAAFGDITVLAAASLTESFGVLARDFEAIHPSTRVTLSFGGSSALATQVLNRAPVDVLALAAEANMKPVTAAGLAVAPMPFASNVLTIITPPANPAKVTGLGDLARPGVKVALCQVQVPCGALSTTVFARAGLSVTPVTWELDVKAVLTKVTLGEVDAGLVYVTDAKAAGAKVGQIPLPTAQDLSTRYPITVLTTAPNRAGADAFVAYVLSPAGQAVLAAAGFASP